MAVTLWYLRLNFIIGVITKIIYWEFSFILKNSALASILMGLKDLNFYRYYQSTISKTVLKNL